MADLFLHGRRIESVFELLGRKENDITFSVGYALSRSPGLLKVLVQRVFQDLSIPDDTDIRLQEHVSEGGFTDIEILGHDLHIICEAKRGWSLPNLRQVELYAERIQRSRAANAAMVVMSECGSHYAKLHLPPAVKGFPVHHLSWPDIHQLATGAGRSNAEKRLLHDLQRYLRSFISMQNVTSNLVYVVVLGGGTPEWSPYSWKQIVQEHHTYFHPVGGSGWPKEPPNYIAFRFDGRLQSIHHIDSWTITDERSEALPGLEPENWGPHFVYKLGNPIFPPRAVPNGSLYPNGRVWAMLDLLLTSDTISQARDRTRERMDGKP
jgi:hypothetical protein